jgi:N-acetylglucosaminyldiphosphoundecaprenol N-acetyl-beta-D-mannosaminyltransferase
MAPRKSGLADRANVASGISGRHALLLKLDHEFSKNGIRQRRRKHYQRSLMWHAAIHLANTCRRACDIVFSLLLILLLSPVLLGMMAIAGVSGGGIRRVQKLGRWGTHFGRYEFYFPESSFLSRFTLLHGVPMLFNVLEGRMAFIGPRAVAPNETLTEERDAWRRYDLRPGLLSLWWLRKRANMAYASEISLDLEYVETKTVWGDMGIAARALPAIFLSVGGSSAPPQLKFLGVRMDNLTMAEASARIINLTQGTEFSQICFINADCVNIAYQDHEYRRVLGDAQLVLADGIGVRLAGTILNQNVRENVNGTDMLPYLCAAAEQAGAGIYLLGGQPGVAEAAAAWMAQSYPRLKICGSHHGFFVSSADETNAIEEIKASGADIVLVALGAPRQDKWIALNKERTGAHVCIGVGGLLDFYSGRIQRAPAWMRELGVEWFFRFWQEPRRMWRRYFVGNGIFLYHVLRERLRARHNGPVESVNL